MNMRVHISLPVTKLAESIKFYEQLFDQPATKVKDDYANFRLDQPSIHLALVQAKNTCCNEPVGPHSHFGVELPDRETFDSWHDRLETTELKGRDEHNIVCCYARAEKVWLTDPDKNEWEIWVRTGEAEQMHIKPQECCAA
jgi:extradiol dioxygenase family protein